MMKKYFAMAAVATMFAACTNEDVTPQVDALTGTPIVVKTNIASPVDSRLAGADDVSDIYGFYLDIVPTATGGTDIFASMSQDLSSGNFNGTTTAESGMTWANSDPVKVSAFFAHGYSRDEDLYGEYCAISPYEDQSELTDLYSIDYLYMAPTEITPTTEGIEVNFKHLMSKVKISITTEENVSDVVIGGACLTRTFKASTGEWGDVTTPREIMAAPDADASTTGNVVYEAILIPQEVAAETFSVSFKIGETTYKWTSAEAVTLESGKHYTINLTTPADPTGEAILLKSINIAEWAPVTTPMGGQATKQ